MAEILKCKISKQMTRGRCIQNMADAEELFGARARECNSCPCDIGLEIRGKLYDAAHPAVIGIDAREEKEDVMSMVGKCENCERDDMKIVKFGGDLLLCGGCRNYCAGTHIGTPEREAALAKARERFRGQPKMPRGKYKKAKVERKAKIKGQKGADAASMETDSAGSPAPDPGKVEEKKNIVIGDDAHQLSKEEEAIARSTAMELLSEFPLIRPHIVPAEAGIQLFISHGSALSLGLRMNLWKWNFNIISLSIGGRHESR